MHTPGGYFQTGTDRGTRTPTVQVLNLLPLPLGYVGMCVAVESNHLGGVDTSSPYFSPVSNRILHQDHTTSPVRDSNP